MTRRGVPVIDPPFHADRTRRALLAWERHHRLMIVSGVLRGLSLPFHRASVAVIPELPSSVLNREWRAALDDESRRQQPSPERARGLMASGESLLDALRAFETADHARILSRHLAGMAVGAALSLACVGLVVVLTLRVGEAWGVGAVLAWFVIASGAVVIQETLVLPGLAARRATA